MAQNALARAVEASSRHLDALFHRIAEGTLAVALVAVWAATLNGLLAPAFRFVDRTLIYDDRRALAVVAWDVLAGAAEASGLPRATAAAATRGEGWGRARWLLPVVSRAGGVGSANRGTAGSPAAASTAAAPADTDVVVAAVVRRPWRPLRPVVASLWDCTATERRRGAAATAADADDTRGTDLLLPWSQALFPEEDRRC